MMRFILALIIMAGPLIPLCGQGGFSHIYEVGGDNLPELLVLDSGYVTITQNNPDWLRLDITEYDFQGQIVDTVSYRFDSIVKNGIENCGNCLRQYRPNRFMYAQTNFDSNVFSYIQFYKLDRSWDTISAHRYRYTHKQTNEPMGSQIYALVFDTDTTFVITGYVYRRVQSTQTDKYDLLVARFDTSFNLLWERRVKDGRPNVRFGYIGDDILIASNGDIIISGFAYLDSGNKSFVCKFSNKGKLIWMQELNSQVGSGKLYIEFDMDSNIVFTAPMDDPNATEKYDELIRFGKLDNKGNVLLDITIGPRLTIAGVTGITKTYDNNFLIAGFTSEDYIEQSFAFKVSPEADSIWMRFYRHGDIEDNSYIYGTAPSPDSGFIHVGAFADVFNTSNPQVYTWLLKTDRYGCVVADCQFVGAPRIPVSAGSIMVYPNPSDGVFVIKRTGIDAQAPLPYAIYSATGRRISQGVIEGAYANVNLSSFAPGLYIVVFRREGKGTRSVKLIVK